MTDDARHEYNEAVIEAMALVIPVKWLDPEHRPDIGRIVDACAVHGIVVDRRSAQYAWQKHAKYLGHGAWLSVEASGLDEWQILDVMFTYLAVNAADA